jgi:anti-sigma B factor antagonist
MLWAIRQPRAAAEVVMVIASRAPERRPNLCPVCGSAIKIEPSDPTGDAPCPECGHLLWFTWEDAGDTVVIKPTGSILRSEDLDTLIEKSSEKRWVRLVLDLSAVHYLSSAALAKLINLKKKLVGERGKLKIENVHPDLLEVFRITGLDKVFDIEE